MLRHRHLQKRQLTSRLSMHGATRRKNRLTQSRANNAFPRRSNSAGSRSFVHVNSTQTPIGLHVDDSSSDTRPTGRLGVSAQRAAEQDPQHSRRHAMNSVGRPQVGDWYQNQDKGEPFQVVSVDAASGTVQIQSFDGELDSIEMEDWERIPLVSAAAPEDWTGPMGDMEPDDVNEDDSPSDRAAALGGN
jgi:hypothetical protein